MSALPHVLFPTLKPDRRGYFSDGFQRWFGRHLSQDLPDLVQFLPAQFPDALREADGRTEEIYGGALKASTLARQIVKVRYPGLDLGVFTCGMDTPRVLIASNSASA